MACSIISRVVLHLKCAYLTERRVADITNVVFWTKLSCFLVLMEWIKPVLYRGHGNTCQLYQLFQIVFFEIADSEAAKFSFLLHVFHRLPAIFPSSFRLSFNQEIKNKLNDRTTFCRSSLQACANWNVWDMVCQCQWVGSKWHGIVCATVTRAIAIKYKVIKEYLTSLFTLVQIFSYWLFYFTSRRSLVYSLVSIFTFTLRAEAFYTTFSPVYGELILWTSQYNMVYIRTFLA